MLPSHSTQCGLFIGLEESILLSRREHLFICLHQDLQPKAAWGLCSPPQTPVSAKGLQLVAGASQGFSLSLEASGPVKGSCRPLWQLCRLFYVPWAELLPIHSPCFPPGTVVELDATLWWGGGTQYFTPVFCCADRLVLRVGASSEPADYLFSPVPVVGDWGVLLFIAISHSTAAFLLFFCSIAEGLHLQQLPDPASQMSPGVGCSLRELLWL